ncbi:hypothetical protein SAVIM40S_00605 [Streptomyces avidinii]
MRGVDQLADLGRVGVAEQVLLVRALAAGVDERPLEVDAGDLALLGQLGEQGCAAGQLVQVPGDGGGDEGGGAVLTVGADALGPLADAGKVKQVQYGMPFVASTRLLFYNEKLLADAGVIGKDAKGWQPKSWADLEAAAEKLKAAGVPTPFALPLGREEAQAETMMWMLAGGGGYTDNEEQYSIDSADNVKALEFLRDKMVGQGLTGPVEPGKLDRQAAFEAFTKGEVGMLNGHPTLLKQAEAKGVKYGGPHDRPRPSAAGGMA